MDKNDGKRAGDISEYQKGLADLEAKCTDDSDKYKLPHELGAAVHEGRKLLNKNGINDTDLSVLQHVDQSIPHGSRVKCVDQIGAYVTLREGQ